MLDLIKQLNSATSAIMGDTVTYSRGGSSVAVSATRGRQLTRVENEVGALVVKGDADFIILAASLIIEGNQIEPQRGDIITDANGIVYDVSAIEAGQDVFTFSDHAGHSLRIHVRKA